MPGFGNDSRRLLSVPNAGPSSSELTMVNRAEWMIYGANGYTGRLVAAEAKRRGLNPLLAGRRAGPIEKLATELGLRAPVFDLQSATAALADIAVVANCAGPFAATSAPMIDACLNSQTHYLDITGEIDVFLAAQRRHVEAKTAGIVICPRRGLRCHSHRLHGRSAQGGPAGRNPPRSRVRCGRLNEPWHRAHDGTICAARPTQRSGASERSDRGSAARARLAACRFRRRLRYGDRHPLGRPRYCLGFDRHTQHRDNTSPCRAAIASRALNWVRPLVASAPGQMLLQQLANRTSGPSEEQLRTGRSRLWGEVHNAAGERRTAHLETANGYRLTADGTNMAVQFLLNAAPSGGYYTPSMLMGARCVEQLPGSSSIGVQ